MRIDQRTDEWITPLNLKEPNRAGGTGRTDAKALALIEHTSSASQRLLNLVGCVSTVVTLAARLTARKDEVPAHVSPEVHSLLQPAAFAAICAMTTILQISYLCK